MERTVYCAHLYDLFQHAMKPYTSAGMSFGNIPVGQLVEESRRYQAFQILQVIYSNCPAPLLKKAEPKDS